MAGGEDRLSELSDDLLRHILHFAPPREAASTAALSRSRRWRAPLWLSTGVRCNLVGLDKVAVDNLPLETLGMLELTDCNGLYQNEAAAVVLPRLSCLRLRHCTMRLRRSLQRLIDAAPTLATVCLESVLIDATYNYDAPCRLRCPVATVLVLEDIAIVGTKYHQKYTVYRLEIDAPMLRRFSYKGQLHPFTFRPQPPELEKVDLHFSSDHNDRNEDRNHDLSTFWRFLRSFTSTKEMRLRVNHLEDMAVYSEARRAELLPAFRRLSRLEVQGVHWTKGKTAAVTIVNLLRCCPVLSAIRINLTAEPHGTYKYKKERRTRIIRKEAQIPALSSGCHLLECLQTSLARVDLQFRLEKPNCFGVKLIEFFAEKATVLEELRIDDGDGKLCELMNPKDERWISNSAKRRKSGATCFVVLPLKKRT